MGKNGWEFDYGQQRTDAPRAAPHWATAAPKRHDGNDEKEKNNGLLDGITTDTYPQGTHCSPAPSHPLDVDSEESGRQRVPTPRGTHCAPHPRLVSPRIGNRAGREYRPSGKE
eukprot:6111314-Pyramimonas_sp.AAC.1